MSLIKKSDVKNHLSPGFQRGIHLVSPASQPDATGFSGEQSFSPIAQSEYLGDGFLPQPAIAMPEADPRAIEPDLEPTAPPAVFKSAQQ